MRQGRVEHVRDEHASAALFAACTTLDASTRREVVVSIGVGAAGSLIQYAAKEKAGLTADTMPRLDRRTALDNPG